MSTQQPAYEETRPTQAELPRLLRNHVQYELHMLQYLATSALPALPVGDIANALKESLLIHARCLMAFFNSQPTKDDVVAKDYLPDWDPVVDGGPELQWLNDNLDRYINKRVAHITAYRLRVPQEQHFVRDVQARIQAIVERFNERQIAAGKAK